MDGFSRIGHFALKNNLNVNTFKPYMDYVYSIRKKRIDITQGKCHRLGMEVHHMVPRCLGGINGMRNKVMLYPDEHLYAHKLLDEALDLCGNKKLKTRHHNTPSYSAILKRFLTRKISPTLIPFYG